MATDNLPAETADQLPPPNVDDSAETNETLPAAMDASDINPVMMGSTNSPSFVRWRYSLASPPFLPWALAW